MSLKHGLLGLLNYGSMTGYELDKAFKASLNFFWQAQTSQIYRELNAMEKLGSLTSELVIQSDKPNKKLYTITENGKAELKRWLALGGSDDFRSSFLMRVFFAGELNTDEAITLLTGYKNENETALAQISNTGQSAEHYGKVTTREKMLYWGLAANFGKAYTQMCVEWADECINILKEVYKK